jgi:uncharacterized protein (DUF1501 family)
MKTRRDFLKKSIASIASVSPLMGILSSLEKLEAAQVEGEYKAIVCVLLEGGCDSFNMIVPRADDSYDDYKEVRGDIALNQKELLPFSYSNQNGLNALSYGMRSNMTQMNQLFKDQKLSIIANVGTLVNPITKNEVLNGASIPSQLFSHNTQRAQWLTGNSKDIEINGWAGRTADLFYPTPNPYFNITVGGNNIMQLGANVESLGFKEAIVSPNTMKYYGFGPKSGGGELGSVYQDIYEQQENKKHKLLSTFTKRRIEELNQQISLKNLFDSVDSFDGFTTGVHETGVSLGKQLELVAQILSVKDNFPGQKKRQIFFVNHHGWDTHASDNEHQVGYLSDSLGAFNAALKKMGIENNVTTFTISDFGRSLTPNGAGTDHGWGGHAFVMGGAVKGGDIYGKMPAIKKDSPDAWEDRLIPTTSIESYLATIVKWFGATENELDTIFPNLKAFSQRNMNFMKNT